MNIIGKIEQLTTAPRFTHFNGFHLINEKGRGTTRPCMRDFDAIAIPIFHSRREAWKFLRSWSKGLTTMQLRRKGYRCLEVKVV